MKTRKTNAVACTLWAIVLCIGINFFGVVKIKTASLLPALLVPLLYNVPMLLKTL